MRWRQTLSLSRGNKDATTSETYGSWVRTIIAHVKYIVWLLWPYINCVFKQHHSTSHHLIICHIYSVVINLENGTVLNRTICIRATIQQSNPSLTCGLHHLPLNVPVKCYMKNIIFRYYWVGVRWAQKYLLN